jgi:pyridoxal phosphate enzyme (YggS family)
VPAASSPPSPTARRLAEVRARIDAALERSGRPPGTVELVAVAKTATPETLCEAWEAGQRLFGHNRVQALEAHREVLPEATWHLLGPIQGKKVRRALAAADLLEAVGDPTVVERLARRLQEDSATVVRSLLVQVNLAPEDGRYGVPLEAVEDFLQLVEAQPLLRAAGLMTIAPLGADEASTRALFRRLAARFEELRRGGLLPLEARLSMGMSGDYETAVEEGATLVRVGRAIFPAADVHEA